MPSENLSSRFGILTNRSERKLMYRKYFCFLIRVQKISQRNGSGEVLPGMRKLNCFRGMKCERIWCNISDQRKCVVENWRTSKTKWTTNSPSFIRIPTENNPTQRFQGSFTRNEKIKLFHGDEVWLCMMQYWWPAKI